MAANLNNNIIINILLTAGAVARTEFGLVCFGSNDVGFASGVHKVYESIAAVRADALTATPAGELTAQCVVAGEAFFAQPVRPPRFMVCEVVDQIAGTELADSLDAAYAAQPFYCLCLQSREILQIVTADLWVAGAGAQQFSQSSDAPFLAGTPGATNVGDTINTAATNRTMVLYHATDAEELIVALAAAFFVTDPDVSTTTLARQKAVGTYTPDVISDTEKASILAVNANVYLQELSNFIVFPGKMGGGGFCDKTLSADWLAARTKENIAQLLQDKAAQKTKIPYTQVGMQDIAGEAVAVQDKGEDVQLAHFVPDSSFVTVPKLATVDAATRAAREFTFSATSILAGAIQTVTVNISVLDA